MRKKLEKRLKPADIPPFREAGLSAQGGIDPITGLPILDPVADHDHASGRMRRVLDRRTNAWEGSVVSSFRRRGMLKMGANLPGCLRALADYLETDWSANPLHPTHRTAEEKKAKRNRRARLKRKRAKN
jgi:hypothetical protein